MPPKFVFMIALLLTPATAAFAQTFPPQPAPPANPMLEGNQQERQACAPDVVKYCQHQLNVNAQDTLAILNCLQTNRPNISAACRTVLANHGQ